jgi:hypothetical protein
VLHMFSAKASSNGQNISAPSMTEGRPLPAHKVVLDFTAVFKDKAHDRLCKMYKVFNWDHIWSYDLSLVFS